MLAGYDSRKISQCPVPEDIQEKGGERSQNVTQKVKKKRTDYSSKMTSSYQQTARRQGHQGEEGVAWGGSLAAKRGQQARSSSAPPEGLLKIQNLRPISRIKESESAPEQDPQLMCLHIQV